MAKKRGNTPDDTAIIVEEVEVDFDTLGLDIESDELESVEIGEPILFDEFASPITPDEPDFSQAIFPDPSSPTGWRDVDGTPIDPETREPFTDESEEDIF